MARRKQKNVQTSVSQELDGVFLFKIVLYLLLGLMWLKTDNGEGIAISLPLGFIVGLAFAAHEHFQIDRKIEYAVLVVAMLVGYLAPFGLYLNY